MARNAVDRLEARPESRLGRDERDTLPEHEVYKDEGCGGECVRSLECPYPRCRYDDPLVWQRIEREERDGEVLAARAALGLTVEALASRFGISLRTVHRILARARAGEVMGRPDHQGEMGSNERGPLVTLSEVRGLPACAEQGRRVEGPGGGNA